MEKFKRDIVPRLLYVLLVGIVIWYAYLIPICLAGYYRNRLVPGPGMFSNSFHVYTIGLLWAFTGSRKVATVAAIVLILFGIAVQFPLNGWPTLDMDRYSYVLNMGLIVSQVVLMPVYALTLLFRADRIAPRIFRGWRSVYG